MCFNTAETCGLCTHRVCWLVVVQTHNTLGEFSADYMISFIIILICLWRTLQ